MTARAARLFILVVAASGAALGTHLPSVRAQPAFAFGHWLPDGKLPAGTVTVRVIAGDVSSAVAEADVTLTVNGTPRTARTAADGRATFSDLPVGATVQATIAGESGDVTSDELTLAADGGAKVLLSTKPPPDDGGGGGGPMAGGGGMPEPRRISGTARPEPSDPPGTLTVRVTYDSFADPSPPDNHPIVLVGYKDDDTVTVDELRTDAGGRVTFKDLDVSGRIAYYAMTFLPRGDKVDRLVSQPIQPLPGVGMRLVLSGEKRDSTEPSVDDYKNLEQQIPNVPAGRVAVAVVTDHTDGGGTIELVDAKTGKVVATENLDPAEDPGDSTAGRFGPFEPDDKVPPGSLRVFALGGPQTGALVGATVTLVPAEQGAPAPMPATTDDNGRATITGVEPGQYRVVLSSEGKEVQSDPITVPADKGGRVVGAMSWFEGIPPRIVQIQSVPSGPSPLYVRVKPKGGVARIGIPFMPAPDHGQTSVFDLGPRLRFGFFFTGSVDDKYYAVSGQLTLVNMWWTPYRDTEDGLVIPLPRGFTGGILADEDKQRVSAEPYAGFRIRRPLPPGPFQFEGGFSLPIEGGAARWDLDLPWGATGSALNLIDSPGMEVDLPPGAKGGPQVSKSGTKFYAINDIDIAPGQSMALSIRGLPMAPGWKLWLPRFAGLVVLFVLGAALWLALRARKVTGGTRAAVTARVQALLDELVDLERRGQPGKRKDAILAELERLWEADGRDQAA